MAKKLSTAAIVKRDTIIKGTSIGRKPIMSSMNKQKRRNFKKYRGQGRG